MLPFIPIIAIGAASAGVMAYVKHKRDEHIAKTTFPLELRSSLLDFGISSHDNINEHLPDGETVLIKAVKLNLDIVKNLLHHGADVNAMDSKGKTALFYASSPQMINLLCKHGADVNAQDIYGKTRLFYTKEPDIFNALLNQYADVNIKDHNGQTVLFSFEHVAVTEEATQILRKIVKINPELIDIEDNNHQKPQVQHIIDALLESANAKLDYALTRFTVSIAEVEEALKAGSDPNKKMRCSYECFPLVFAIHINRPDILRLLIQYGGNVNLKIYNDTNLLTIAIQELANNGDDLGCLKVLLDAGIRYIDQNYIQALKSPNKEAFKLIYPSKSSSKSSANAAELTDSTSKASRKKKRRSLKR